jgi:hypothetical protein
MTTSRPASNPAGAPRRTHGEPTKEIAMTRRTKRIVTAGIAAITTMILVWLPTAAHAGITLNAID